MLFYEEWVYVRHDRPGNRETREESFAKRISKIWRGSGGRRSQLSHNPRVDSRDSTRASKPYKAPSDWARIEYRRDNHRPDPVNVCSRDPNSQVISQQLLVPHNGARPERPTTQLNPSSQPGRSQHRRPNRPDASIRNRPRSDAGNTDPLERQPRYACSDADGCRLPCPSQATSTPRLNLRDERA